MENTTKMVDTIVRGKGSNGLYKLLPKGFPAELSKITGIHQQTLANILRGRQYGDYELVKACERIAELNKEFCKKKLEILKPFENVESDRD